MKNRILSIIAFIGMLPVCVAEQAALKPRKQKASEIKQEIAEIGGEVLKLCAETIQATAQMQKKLIDEFIQLADGVDDSFFVKAKVEQLAIHRDALLKLQNSYTCMRTEQEKGSYSLMQSLIISK